MGGEPLRHQNYIIGWKLFLEMEKKKPFNFKISFKMSKHRKRNKSREMNKKEETDLGRWEGMEGGKDGRRKEEHLRKSSSDVSVVLQFVYSSWNIVTVVSSTLFSGLYGARPAVISFLSHAKDSLVIIRIQINWLFGHPWARLLFPAKGNQYFY